MVKSIAVKTLKPGYSMFGNKGAVWSKTVHIAKNGLHGTTMCGTPMLSSNHARIEGVPEVGCPKCIAAYLKEQSTPPMEEYVDDHLKILAEKHSIKLNRWRGSGVDMMLQPYRMPLEIGDHVWDADFGFMIWDGTKWVY